MSRTDIQYFEIIKDILENGYYDNNRTGIPTYKVFGKMFSFDLQKEFPILTTKFVPFKSAVKELLWIYQMQSNDVKELNKMGVHYWDAWQNENGTIGRAYGYQVAKYKQIDRLINTLKTNPQDRGMIISLWNIEDLPFMQLRPCAFQTIWDVSDGYLNCTLIQRSGDMPLGVPVNMTQYAVLVHMIAQVTGLKPGKFNHYINNAHIYNNQIEGIKEQLSRSTDYPDPKLWINPDIKNFYDFTIEDIKLIDYKHHPKIEFPVAI
jgi:thymidylate synthase